MFSCGRRCFAAHPTTGLEVMCSRAWGSLTCPQSPVPTQRLAWHACNSNVSISRRGTCWSIRGLTHQKPGSVPPAIHLQIQCNKWSSYLHSSHNCSQPKNTFACFFGGFVSWQYCSAFLSPHSGNKYTLLCKLPASLSLFSKFPSHKCLSFAQSPLPELMLPLRGQVDKSSTLPSAPTPLITVEVLDHCSLLQRLHEPLQAPLSDGHSVLICTLLMKEKGS